MGERMKRLLTILCLVTCAAFPLTASAQDEPVWIEYSDETMNIENEFMADGLVVVISYMTEWCNACETQQSLIDRMRVENPDYEKMKYIQVDIDTYDKRPIVRNFDVFGRSTILVMRSGGEVANVFAETSRNVLRDALDAGLAAALENEASGAVTN